MVSTFMWLIQECHYQPIKCCANEELSMLFLVSFYIYVNTMCPPMSNSRDLI